jgi:gamma-glutamylputrescine oxidase
VPTSSYWLSGPLPELPQRASLRRAEVVVVGGGVTGCACALALAQAGVSVALLEAGEVASGASGRNGGFALRGAATSYQSARALLGPAPARMLWELSERALERMEQLAGDAFRRVGSLRLAADAEELALLEEELEALGADGFDGSRVTRLPAPLQRLYTGAVLSPGDGALHPARFVRGLAARALQAGAEIVERRAVAPAELETLDCDAVVLALDGSTTALAPELARYVEPVRGQVLVTEPLPTRIYERPHYARHGFDYWQQLPDGRLLVGGRRDTSLAAERTGEDATTEAVQAQLDGLAAALLGAPPAVSHRFSGCWGETPDRLPLVGRVPGRGRVWVAGGYSGHGNVLGLACGELVARALLGETPAELALFDPLRLAASAGAAGGSPP